MPARKGVDVAYGASVNALVAVIAELTRLVQALAAPSERAFRPASGR